MPQQGYKNGSAERLTGVGVGQNSQRPRTDHLGSHRTSCAAVNCPGEPLRPNKPIWFPEELVPLNPALSNFKFGRCVCVDPEDRDPACTALHFSSCG